MFTLVHRRIQHGVFDLMVRHRAANYMLFLASEEEFKAEKPMALTMMTILDWHSRKLPRMSRSSLSAESPAASAAAVDELEYIAESFCSCHGQPVCINPTRSDHGQFPSIFVDRRATQARCAPTQV